MFLTHLILWSPQCRDLSHMSLRCNLFTSVRWPHRATATNIWWTSVKWVWRNARLCTQPRLSFKSGPVLFDLILRSFSLWTPTLLCILSRASKLQRKWGLGTLPVSGTSLAVSLTQICLSEDWSFSNELDGRFQPTAAAHVPYHNLDKVNWLVGPNFHAIIALRKESGGFAQSDDILYCDVRNSFEWTDSEWVGLFACALVHPWCVHVLCIVPLWVYMIQCMCTLAYLAFLLFWSGETESYLTGFSCPFFPLYSICKRCDNCKRWDRRLHLCI